MDCKSFACVIAYYPDAEFFGRLDSITPQVDQLVIVDNSQDGSLQAPSLFPGIILRNFNKGGVAGALNVAVRHARANGASYLAVFDHDSNVPARLVQTLVNTSSKHGASITGPVYTNAATGAPGRFVLVEGDTPDSRWLAKGTAVHEAFFIINSGSVLALDRIPVEIIYDETLEVDMVDVDYCLQLREAGGKVVLDTSVVMSHGIGNRTAGASRFSPPNYSLQRHAMIIGNRVLMWRRWRARYPRYVVMDVRIAVLDFIRNLMLLPNRFAYARSILLGVRTGAKKSVGRVS